MQVMEEAVMESMAGADKIQQVPLEKIVPSRTNPRRINTRSPKFLQLVESVRQNGVIFHGIARPHPNEPDLVELWVGERRFRASQEAGRPTMPLVVIPMDDRTATKLMVIENKDRDDLTPTEEARGIQAMMDVGCDAEAIAADLGVKKSYVLRRQRLLKLAPAWVEAFETEGSPYSVWKAAHLELIARFDEATQLRIKAQFDKYSYRLGVKTVADLEADLADFLMVLSKAPWDLNDETLVKKAGACATCPKRSDAIPELFETVQGKKLHASCTDLPCWKKKDRAWLDRKLTLMRAQHEDLVTLSRDYDRGSADFTEHSVSPAKAGQKGAVPALVVRGTDRGELVWVKPKADPEPEVARAPTVGQLRERLMWDRRRMMVQRLEADIGALKQPPKGLATAERMLAAVLAVAMLDDKKAVKVFATKGKQLVHLAFKSIQEAVTSNNFDECPIEVLVHLAGADLKAVKADAAKALPEPEAWKGLKEKDPAPQEGTAVAKDVGA